jgi:hypothetical protein
LHILPKQTLPLTRCDRLRLGVGALLRAALPARAADGDT